MDHHQRSINKFTAEDKFYSAIGRFIFEFSQLEYTLKYHIAEVIELKDEYFNAITSFDFSMICTIAESVLLPKLPRRGANQLKKIINTCRELNGDRVRVAHGLWYINRDTGTLHAISRQNLTASQHFDNDATAIACKADLANTLRNEIPRILYSIERDNPRPTGPRGGSIE